MLKNYIKVALRGLLRNKLISSINIFGLALGMACSIIILMYVVDEQSYDRWLPDADRLYRVSMDITNLQGEHLLFAPASATLAAALEDYPQVEQATRLVPPFEESVTVSTAADKVFYETGFYWADPDVFELFQYDFLAGMPTTALEGPRNIVITRAMAEKYFAVKDDFGRLLDQPLKMDTTEYVVSGVIENIPENTSFRPDFIASLKEWNGLRIMDNWHATVFHTFVKLNPGTDAAAFEQQIKNIADKYVGEEIKTNAQGYRYFLQPLTSIHLHSKLRYEFSKNNSHRYVQIFGLVALFILLLAAINFVNLVTVYASRRAKEVAVRKTTGAQRRQLIGQFLTETTLTSLAAALIAIGMVALVLPSFNVIAEKQFELSTLLSSRFAILLLSIMVSTGVLAGIYPAFILSKFKPAEAFRGRLSGRSKTTTRLRSGLVIAQFVISTALIVSTLVLSKQMAFLKKQNLGFDKEHLLVLSAPGSTELVQNYTAVRTELSRLAGVRNVCLTGIVPGKTYPNNLVALQGDRSKSTDMQLMQIDEHYLKTYNIPLVAGRNISENIPEDLTSNVLINEAALPFYGWSSAEEALGKTFDSGWGTIVGVVKNFHFNSLHRKVLPLEMYFSQRRFNYVTLNVQTPDLGGLLAELKSTWSSLLPGTPFSYSFLDETFDKQYRFEERLSTLFSIFGLLAIVIACLGLFGLAAFMAEQRTKEIGIRKVLGASVAGIVGLLSKDFLILVLIAILIASPLTWYFMEEWLRDFAYRIEVEWWMFALGGILAVSVAFITISFQSVKAALLHPVESLRSE